METLENIKLTIDLAGPGGNAFVLLNYASRYADRAGVSFTNVSRNMRSSDYNHLLRVFEENFSDYVRLINKPKIEG